jgi:hypothetical protein
LVLATKRHGGDFAAQIGTFEMPSPPAPLCKPFQGGVKYLISRMEHPRQPFRARIGTYSAGSISSLNSPVEGK